MPDTFTASAQEVSDCMDAITAALNEVAEQFSQDAFEIAMAALEGDIPGPHETIN